MLHCPKNVLEDFWEMYGSNIKLRGIKFNTAEDEHYRGSKCRFLWISLYKLSLYLFFVSHILTSYLLHAHSARSRMIVYLGRETKMLAAANDAAIFMFQLQASLTSGSTPLMVM